MPTVSWGIQPAAVDDWDRDSQYKPYAGPIPPDGVYAWTVKVLKHVAGDRKKNPQLRAGLELVPRADFDEDKYRGYFIMDFLPIIESTNWRYVPFLDALGVSGRDFTRTKTDQDGNVLSMGQWRNKGDSIVVAQLVMGQDQNGNPRKEIRPGSYADLGSDIELSDADDVELPDDDDFSDNTIDEDFEEDGPSNRRNGTRATVRGGSRTKRTVARSSIRTRKGSASARVRASRKRPANDDGYDDEMGF